MNIYKTKRDKRLRRHKRVRAKIRGSAGLPRLSVFRSNKYLYAQLIDDDAGRTITSASALELKPSSGKKKVENVAEKVGGFLAKKALRLGIKKVVFDRGGYAYHGNIKKLADSARKAGLIF